MPIINIQSIPAMGNAFLMVLGGGIVFAIVKYSFLVITPATAADNIISTMDEFLILLSQEGNILTVNKAIIDSLKYEQKELEGKSINTLFKAESLTPNLLERIINGENIKNADAVFQTKNGEEIQIIFSSSPLKDEEGNIAGIVFIARDITELKHAEEEKEKLQAQLLRSEKMAAIGQLAGGIAHDFNNILFIIQGNTELLKFKFSSQQEEYRVLESIERSSRRGAELTKELLSFARRTPAMKKLVNLNSIIKEVSELLKRTIEKMIVIDLHLNPDLWMVEADSSQMYQVILNICINAKEAIMPNTTGKLIIETQAKEFHADDIQNYPDAHAGKYIVVMISDTGKGMDQETMKRVFEPFFTTKEVGKGVGLGLAVAYGIIKEHKGFINVYSEKGKGSCFKIYLPAIESEQKAEIKQESKDKEILVTGKETIMVVDDEPTVRELAKSILERFGYQVIQAQNGNEALQQYQSQKEKIDMVILDLIMPGLSGVETLKELRKTNPAVKVLIASGYSSNGTTKDVVNIGISGFITKPFTIKELLQEVQNILHTDYK